MQKITGTCVLAVASRHSCIHYPVLPDNSWVCARRKLQCNSSPTVLLRNSACLNIPASSFAGHLTVQHILQRKAHLPERRSMAFADNLYVFWEPRSDVMPSSAALVPHLWLSGICTLGGSAGLDFVFHMFFLIKYSKSLEEGSFRGRSADFLWMLLIGERLLISCILCKYTRKLCNFTGPRPATTLHYCVAPQAEQCSPVVPLLSTSSFLGLPSPS